MLLSISSYTYLTCVSSLMHCLFRSLPTGFFFLLVSFRSSLSILDCLYQIPFANIFSKCPACFSFFWYFPFKKILFKEVFVLCIFVLYFIYIAFILNTYPIVFGFILCFSKFLFQRLCFLSLFLFLMKILSLQIPSSHQPYPTFVLSLFSYNHFGIISYLQVWK